MRSATVVILLLLTGLAHADERKTVLLLPLEGPAGAEGETVAEAARDLLAAAISRPDGPRLVDREALERVLAEQERAARAAPDAVRIGKLLGATHAVKGTVARLGRQWRIVLVLLNVPGGAVLGTVDQSGPPAEVAGVAGEKLAHLIAGTTRPTDLRPDPAALASLHYLRGIGYLRAGLSLEAIGELLEAKRLAVRFPETRFWMARAYLDAGLPDHARIEAMAFLNEAPDHSLAAEARGIMDSAEERASASPAEINPPSAPEETPLDRLRRELLSPNLADRHAAARRAAAKLPRDAKEECGPELAILLEVARDGPPAASLNALRVLVGAGRREGFAMITERVVDESVSPAYRTEMLGLLHQGSILRKPDLQAALLRLILHENDPLRTTVHYLVNFWEHRKTAPEEVRAAALAALRDRRFPHQAGGLACLVRWEQVPDASRFARTLLRSTAGVERRTGLYILGEVDPDGALVTAWNFLEDEQVRQSAFRLVQQHHPDPAQGFLRILERWDTLAQPIENPGFRTQRDNMIRYALRDLAKRALDLKYYGHGTPKLPAVKAGPEAFRRWFEVWTTRARDYEELLPKWTAAAKGEERDRLFVELAATGNPTFLDLVHRRKLGPVDLEALTAFARATGYDEHPSPEPGAKPDEINLYRYRITNWVLNGPCNW